MYPSVIDISICFSCGTVNVHLYLDCLVCLLFSLLTGCLYFDRCILVDVAIMMLEATLLHAVYLMLDLAVVHFVERH